MGKIIYGPAAANPNRGEPKPMGPEEYRKFHAQQEAQWGIEAAAKRAEENGTTLMVKDPINGEVHPYKDHETSASVGQLATGSVIKLAA